MDKIVEIKSLLGNKYKPDGNEEVGFIHVDNSLLKVIQVPNMSGMPSVGFDIDVNDIQAYALSPNCFATWHTHPGSTSNLSGEDHDMFQQWDNLYHFIVGSDGVKCFKYSDLTNMIMEIFSEE